MRGREAGRNAWEPAVRAGMSTQVSMEMIKALRIKTGCPIKDCRNALADEEVNGDLEKAVEWLRKKGMATAAKKSGRPAADGLVSLALSQDGRQGVLLEVCPAPTHALGSRVRHAMRATCWLADTSPAPLACRAVQLNSETDFVARNGVFQSLLARVTDVALRELPPTTSETPAEQAERLLAVRTPDGTVGELVQHAVGQVQENLVLRRATKLVAPDNGLLAPYVHQAAAEGMGRKAALMAMACSAPLTEQGRAALLEAGTRLAMHAVVAAPRFLSRDVVPQEVVERERAIVLEQVAAAAEGKPESVVAKMVEGRLSKFLDQVSLLEQQHLVEDGNVKVSKVLKELSKPVGGNVTVEAFAAFAVGDAE